MMSIGTFIDAEHRVLKTVGKFVSNEEAVMKPHIDETRPQQSSALSRGCVSIAANCRNAKVPAIL